MPFAIHLFADNFGLANGDFKALATHRFDEYREVQQTATRDFEAFLLIGFFNLQGHVGLQFAIEPVPDNGLVLGFGGVGTKVIEAGVAVLAQVLEGRIPANRQALNRRYPLSVVAP